MITGMLIKRVRDNMQLAETIVGKHYGPDINSSISKYFQSKISSFILKSIISAAFQNKKRIAAGETP